MDSAKRKVESLEAKAKELLLENDRLLCQFNDTLACSRIDFKASGRTSEGSGGQRKDPGHEYSGVK